MLPNHQPPYPTPWYSAVALAQPDYINRLAIAPNDPLYPSGTRSSGMWFLRVSKPC